MTRQSRSLSPGAPQRTLRANDRADARPRGRKHMRLATIVLAVCLGTGSALAADLNCSQVKLVVPYPAAGATDVATRIVAERLEAAIKKTVFVENRAGATGNIGTSVVVGAEPNGCTLLVNATVIATFPTSFSKLKYDPFKDLAPVGGVGITPSLILVAPSIPASDVKSLVALSKQREKGITYAVAGYGLQQHLATEEIAQRSGAKFVIVPYKGGGAAMTDLIAARVEFGTFLAGTSKGLVQEGKLKALAVVQDKRSDLMPNVPTTAEQGFPGLIGGVHFMLFAPAATPKATIAYLSGELRKAIGDPALKQRFLNVGFEPTPMSPEEVTAAMRQTTDAYAPIIKRLNITLD
ncbi:MAG: tripartite tricarboxylate transporter substrate binding protein [Rhizobiales bacterium]|nr:tripartite tricarboxylate transporter substrate binding protein [Hyphomicrobiales bacterium]